MPQSLAIGILVLGAVMLLLALAGGSFKIFGSEMPTAVNRSARVIAFGIGVVLVGVFPVPLPARPGARKRSRIWRSAPPGPSRQPDKAATEPAGRAGVLAAAPKETLNDPSAVRVFGREGTDFGVPPRNAIQENVAAPTPLTIPGARTISTGELYSAGTSRPSLPARRCVGVAARRPPGGEALSRRGHADRPPPIWPSCSRRTRAAIRPFRWSSIAPVPSAGKSYNAALRARDAGYTNVYWYRGGLELWSVAGLPLS